MGRARTCVAVLQETGQNAYVGDATALADGKKLYLEWCEASHLADGSGRIGASLIAAQHIYPRTATDVGLFEAVAMRPFNDKMTQDQILR